MLRDMHEHMLRSSILLESVDYEPYKVELKQQGDCFFADSSIAIDGLSLNTWQVQSFVLCSEGPELRMSTADIPRKNIS